MSEFLSYDLETIAGQGENEQGKEMQSGYILEPQASNT